MQQLLLISKVWTCVFESQLYQLIHKMEIILKLKLCFSFQLQVYLCETHEEMKKPFWFTKHTRSTNLVIGNMGFELRRWIQILGLPPCCCCCAVAKSCLTFCAKVLQHARPPCPSLSPWVCSNSCPLSQWCHPTISSSVVPFSSCPQSSPASGLSQWVSS